MVTARTAPPGGSYATIARTSTTNCGYCLVGDVLTNDCSVWTGTDGWVLVTLSAGWLAVRLSREAIPPLIPTLIDDLQTSPSTAGFSLTEYSHVYALSQYPDGRLFGCALAEDSAYGESHRSRGRLPHAQCSPEVSCAPRQIRSLGPRNRAILSAVPGASDGHLLQAPRSYLWDPIGIRLRWCRFRGRCHARRRLRWRLTTLMPHGHRRPRGRVARAGATS
jgi:hypothetical protein